MLEQNLTSLMIVTLGFGYVLQGAAARIFGGEPQHAREPASARGSIRMGELWFSGQDLLVFAVTSVAVRCAGSC